MNRRYTALADTPLARLLLRTAVALIVLGVCLPAGARSEASTGGGTLAMPVSPASIDTTPPGPEFAPYRLLLDELGVREHLASIADTVLQESGNARRDCATQGAERPHLVARIREQFAEALLMQRSARLLHQALQGSTALGQARRWMDSEAGRRIRQAEQALGALTDSELDARVASLGSSTGWTPARQALVTRYLRATRTPRFVVTQNIEISAAVTAASVCLQAAERPVAPGEVPLSEGWSGLELAREAIEQDRGDAAFLTVFMARQLLPATAVAMEPVDSTDLQRGLNFAHSPDGRQFYAALVAATTAALAESVEQMLLP